MSSTFTYSDASTTSSNDTIITTMRSGKNGRYWLCEWYVQYHY